jgi:hypothetical protein
MHQGRDCGPLRTGSRLAVRLSHLFQRRTKSPAHKERTVLFLNFVLHDCSAGPAVEDAFTPVVPDFVSPPNVRNDFAAEALQHNSRPVNALARIVITLGAIFQQSAKPLAHRRTQEIMNSGQIVLVTLQNPREKFWGVLLALTPAGASLRGVDLQSLDDFTQLVKSGEATTASLVFFPMHRVQRIEVDSRSGELPSLADQFTAKTGIDVAKFFQEPQ